MRKNVVKLFSQESFKNLKCGPVRSLNVQLFTESVFSSVWVTSLSTDNENLEFVNLDSKPCEKYFQ